MAAARSFCADSVAGEALAARCFFAESTAGEKLTVCFNVSTANRSRSDSCGPITRMTPQGINIPGLKTGLNSTPNETRLAVSAGGFRSVDPRILPSRTTATRRPKSLLKSSFEMPLRSNSPVIFAIICSSFEKVSSATEVIHRLGGIFELWLPARTASMCRTREREIASLKSTWTVIPEEGNLYILPVTDPTATTVEGPVQRKCATDDKWVEAGRGPPIDELTPRVPVMLLLPQQLIVVFSFFEVSGRRWASESCGQILQ